MRTSGPNHGYSGSQSATACAAKARHGPRANDQLKPKRIGTQVTASHARSDGCTHQVKSALHFKTVLKPPPDPIHSQAEVLLERPGAPLQGVGIR